MTSREEEMRKALERAELEDQIEDERPEVYLRPKPPRGPSQVYSIRIPVERVEELRRVAHRRGIAPTGLIRTWVIEKLEEEKGSSVRSVPITGFRWDSEILTSALRQVDRHERV